MLRFSPILIAIIYGIGMYWFSALRLRKTLDTQSVELLDPSLNPVLSRLATALDVKKVKIHLYEVDPVKINKEINFKLLKEIANECFMPLAYGGGIKCIDDAKKTMKICCDLIYE